MKVGFHNQRPFKLRCKQKKLQPILSLDQFKEGFFANMRYAFSTISLLICKATFVIFTSTQLEWDCNCSSDPKGNVFSSNRRTELCKCRPPCTLSRVACLLPGWRCTRLFQLSRRSRIQVHWACWKRPRISRRVRKDLKRLNSKIKDYAFLSSFVNRQ